MLGLVPQAYLIFDDTVLDKSFGPKIEAVRKQWSGNAKGVILGIGVVSCVYVNPETERFWVVDYRVFDPDADGKSKLDHVEEMLRSAEHRRLPFRAVLMDSWYATKDRLSGRAALAPPENDQPHKSRLLRR
jgi:DDE superfamily endonuclease